MKVFVKSFGCSTNLADGEVMAGCLLEAGHELVQSISAADLIICNTCAVKGPTENRAIHYLSRIPTNKKLVVAGCLPLINFERLHKKVRFNGVVGPAAGEAIVKAVDCVAKGERFIAAEGSLNSKPSLSLPRLRANPVISIVPISYGCSGSCAYCCVVFARGRLRSYGIEEIAERVKCDVTSGSKEIWLTSQDTASYGIDIKTNLAQLLNALCRIQGDFKIRIGMMTPNIITRFLKETIQAFKDEHVFKFVHLPVQSGDDKVLKKMQRFYSVIDFKRIVEAFRAKLPSVTLSTDVICGFPGESREAFERTLALLEEVEPDIVNVSKFFPRPNTLALEMRNEFVSYSEIKRRSTAAAALARKTSAEKNGFWINWFGDILIDEVGKVPGSWIGRNFAYKPVVVKSQDNLLGKTLKIKVARAFSTHLEGEIVG